MGYVSTPPFWCMRVTTRREFVAETAALVAGVAAVPQKPRTASKSPAVMPPFELEEATIADLAKGMQAGKYTARSLCQAYLSHIAQVNTRGPAIRAVLEVNPDALAIADALDAERKANGARGPLHGIPVLLKDNIATADRMATTAGSLALVGATAPRDAFVADRLRAAGAVLLGKTNMSEWANFRSTHSSSGWSGRGGQCRNPYALDRSPCGSSSGSGAAIAANLAAAAIGTETDGSIVCPSSAQALVGIKPTLGLVSRWGIVPIAHSQDTAGPMARTVADAALLLGVITGADSRDASTAGAESHRSDYVAALDPNGMRGVRVGVARTKLFGYHPPTDKVAEAAIDAMKQLGAVIVDPADIPHVGEYDDAELDVLLYEFKADLKNYLAEFGAGVPYRSVRDLIDFNLAHAREELVFFDQDLFVKADAKGGLDDAGYAAAVEKCRTLAIKQGLEAAFAQFNVDVFVAPTGNPAWTIDLVNGDHFVGSSSTPAAVAGYPSITVPAGFVAGLPVGISLIGKPYSEPLLVRVAYAYEQASKMRRPPRFLPSADLRAP